MQTEQRYIIKVHDTPWSVQASVIECSLCRNDVGTVRICEGGHVICRNCFGTGFDRLDDCLLCHRPLDTREATATSGPGTLLPLNNIDFYCQGYRCQWRGGYHELVDHKAKCPKQILTCIHGCEQQLPRNQMAAHEQQQCDQRPHQQGYFKGPYHQIEHAKRLKVDLQEANDNPSLTQAQMKSLLQRAAKFSEQVLDAPITEQSEEVPCRYQCGLIATAPEQLAGHFAHCPEKPIECRHCHKFIPLKNIGNHQSDCDLRTMICGYCHGNFPPILINSHMKCCTSRPVACDLCSDLQPLNTLESHKLLCPQRAVTCESCLTPTVYQSLQSCWCKQSITLATQAFLVPQNHANCPVYQEIGHDDSVIYLATKLGRFRKGLRQPGYPLDVFKQGARFTFCGRTATVVWTKEEERAHSAPRCPAIRLCELGPNSRGQEQRLERVDKRDCIPAQVTILTDKTKTMLNFYSYKVSYTIQGSIQKTVHIFHSYGEGKAWLDWRGKTTDPLDDFLRGSNDKDILMIRIAHQPAA